MGTIIQLMHIHHTCIITITIIITMDIALSCIMNIPQML